MDRLLPNPTGLSFKPVHRRLKTRGIFNLRWVGLKLKTVQSISSHALANEAARILCRATEDRRLKIPRTVFAAIFGLREAGLKFKPLEGSNLQSSVIRRESQAVSSHPPPLNRNFPKNLPLNLQGKSSHPTQIEDPKHNF